MRMGGTPHIIILVLSIGLYFISVVYLSKKRNSYLGLILPVIFVCIAIYNFIKPILVYNPYPTMKEGIYMTFFGTLSIVGFIIFILLNIVGKRKNDNFK